MKYLSIFAVALGIFATGCRSTERPATPAADEKIASLERGLDRQRDIEAYLMEVQDWSRALLASAPPEQHDRAEATASDLLARAAHLKSTMDRSRSERFSGWNPALAGVAREYKDLRDAHYRAIADNTPQRREEEKAMSERLDTMGQALTDFRVEASSFTVASNAEVHRRAAFLDLGRREAGETLKDLEKARPTNWPSLRRRWDQQIASWDADHREALERLKVVIEKKPEAKT